MKTPHPVGWSLASKFTGDGGGKRLSLFFIAASYGCGYLCTLSVALKIELGEGFNAKLRL